MRKLTLALTGGIIAIGVAVVMAAPSPPSPLPIADAEEYVTFDVQVHERGSTTSLPVINAQHGSDCSGPPATHANSTFEGSVFICGADANRHVMTAINGSSYGLIVLTPNLLFDFSQGGSVTFDLSTEKMSNRDWWDLTISPFTDAQALPLLSDLSEGVDLQGPNRNSIVVSTDNGQGSPNLKVVRNGVRSDYGGSTPADSGIAPGTNQAAVRQPFKLTIADGRIKFERLASATGSAVTFFDVATTANFTQGVVQFGHHSYDPFKNGAGVAATWHWDNLDAQPSTPFTILHASPRALFSAGTVTYPPAPSGAFLRFSALCRPIVNGVALTKMTDSGHPEHASSYMVPVPAGSTSATLSFTADGWYTTGFGCQGKDFHVWSLDGGSAPTVTSTPTTAPTATATITPLPPTATATAVATSTSIPTATATPSSTPTPTPTTPSGFECRTRDQRQTRPVGGTTWQTANDPWGPITIVASRAECVGD
jgi:hypothetical protein